MDLGIDLGTSSVKLLLVDDAQRAVDEQSVPLDVARPHPGWSEQDPEDWWRATEAAARALRARRPEAMARVRAIGLAGQMHGATLLDAADRVLRPAILWNDGRSAAECAALEAAEPRSRWTYWQRRAGNDIGNQLYEEGDYLNALLVYSALSALDTALPWQLPVYYQMGLIYERLQQPLKASETYGRILAREKELASGSNPALQTVVDMARWRMQFLDWQTQNARPAPTNAQTAAAAAPLATGP